jgi:glycosyltransferase involved in cell wall biosynthesis
VAQHQRPKILFVVNDASFFVSHRLRLAQEAQAKGFETVVACGAASGEAILADQGIRTRPFVLSRSGFNPISEWRSYRALLRIYREEAPDIVHHVTIKPVLYGTIAACAANVPGVVNAISGLGFIFTQRGRVAGMKRRLVNLLYRFALRHPNMHVIFQNREDLRDFVDGMAAIPERHAHLIRGSGVDLDAFPLTPEPPTPPTFVLVARMLRDKGVGEFVAAARMLRAKHPDWRFQLVGGTDAGNPSSISEAELQSWSKQGCVEWLGHRSDVRAVLQAAHVVCLPSYREGLPKSLLEAAAVGRPMIAADVPGCREVVRDGITGLLVPPRDCAALADAMRRLGEDASLRGRLGRAAHERALALYSIEDVIHDTFLIYAAVQGA